MRNHGYFCCTLFCVLYFCSFCHGLWNFFPSFCKINVGITIFLCFDGKFFFFFIFVLFFVFWTVSVFFFFYWRQGRGPANGLSGLFVCAGWKGLFALEGGFHRTIWFGRSSLPERTNRSVSGSSRPNVRALSASIDFARPWFTEALVRNKINYSQWYSRSYRYPRFLALPFQYTRLLLPEK